MLQGIGQFEMQPVREGEACRKFSSLHGHNAQGTRSLHSMPGGGCEKADIKPHSVVYVSRLPAGAQRRFWHGPRSEPEMHELRFQGHKTEGRANMSQQGLQAQVSREAGAGSGEKALLPSMPQTMIEFYSCIFKHHRVSPTRSLYR